MGRRADGRGFSLFEVLVALALAGLFAAGAGYSVGRLGPRLRLRAGVWAVTSGLGQARFRAVMSGQPVRVRFAGSRLVFERPDDASGTWRTARTEVLDGVAVEANAAPVFYPQGTVAPLAAVTVGNAAGAYRITVAITGRIRSVRTG
jgi:prepilin-type N-terminal cleavage/methylation domain-containing protein